MDDVFIDRKKEKHRVINKKILTDQIFCSQCTFLIEEEGFDSLDYRYFCLQSRYRKQLVFSFDALQDAKNSYKKLKSKILSIVKSAGNNDRFDDTRINSYKKKFSEQISDDLNIPNAFTVLSQVIKDNDLTNKEKYYLIEDFDKVLSLNLLIEDSKERNMDIDEEYVHRLIDERNQARKSRDWAKADELRDELSKINVEIVDSKEETTWKLKK